MQNEVKISRKEQIINTAELLFKEKGYMATTMRDIAKCEGVEAASLYSHIKSKDEILITICFHMADQFEMAIREVNDIYFNAEEKIRMAIKNHINIITNDLNASAVFIKEWRHLPEPELSMFIHRRHDYEDEFKIILQQGVDENVFEDVNKKFAVLTILSTISWIVEWYKPDGSMTPDEISEKLSDFILTGLKRKNTF
jgi:AcrR family transcriptional regulator